MYPAVLDVSINKYFKNHVRKAFEKHLNENFALYTESKLTTSDRCKLTTKLVANAWATSKADKEMIRKSFVKCGLSNKIDGSEYHLVNFRGIED